LGEEPEEQRESGAEDEAGDDGKVEGGVFATMDDVAGKAAKAQGELAAKVEERAENDQEDPEDEEHTAEFSEGVHKEDSRRNDAKK